MSAVIRKLEDELDRYLQERNLLNAAIREIRSEIRKEKKHQKAKRQF